MNDLAALEYCHYVLLRVVIKYPLPSRYEYRLAAETSIGVGPFSAVQLADTVANTLEEPPTGPFYTQIWFIVVMVAVVVLLIMSVGGTFLLVAYATKYKSQGTYSCEYM